VDKVIEVLVFGSERGAVFALVGLGLALVYKATRILNFAQGELGTVPAFVALMVMTGFETTGDQVADRGLLIPAIIAAVAVGAVLGVVLYLVVIRPLGKVSAVTSLVATAGVALLLTTVEINLFEAKARRFPRPVAGGFRLIGTDVIVDWHALVILAALAAAALALAAFFRSAPGLALRPPPRTPTPPSSRASRWSGCGRWPGERPERWVRWPASSAPVCSRASPPAWSRPRS
jgi:branched-chain amino acid transport system permease protein